MFDPGAVLKLLTLLIKCAIGLLTLAGALLALYFFRGSLEEFPTEDDHEKVRIVSGLLLGLVAVGELLLFLALGLVGRSKKEV